MRTEKEILQRIQEIRDQDFFGTQIGDLVEFLSFDNAKKFLKDGTEQKDWEDERVKNDRDTILKKMQEYMSFAWGKANNCRGLSAARSMDHFTTWIWLLGDDLGNLSDYEFYGKDKLVSICEKYGWDHSQWDDGVRSNTEC